MTELQKVMLRLSEIRQRLNELGGVDDLSEEQRNEIDTLSTEYTNLETRSRALTIANGKGEERKHVSISDYVSAAAKWVARLILLGIAWYLSNS